MQTQQYEDLLKAIKNLPPLPASSLRIIHAVNDPDISIDELVDILSTSPAIVARLIGLANSAFFGQSNKIDSLRRAIIQVLGIKLVKSLSLSIALNVQLDAKKCPAFNAEKHWTEALTHALVMQKLARLTPYDSIDPVVAYTTGLFGNLGVLVCVYLFPGKMQQIYTHPERSCLTLEQEIYNTFGCHHHQLCYIIFKKWNLPTTYQMVLKEFNNKHYAGIEAPLILLLQLCQRISVPIVTKMPYEITQFQEFLKTFRLTEDRLHSMIEEVMSNRDNIDELAAIISG